MATVENRRTAIVAMRTLPATRAKRESYCLLLGLRLSKVLTRGTQGVSSAYGVVAQCLHQCVREGQPTPSRLGKQRLTVLGKLDEPGTAVVWVGGKTDDAFGLEFIGNSLHRLANEAHAAGKARDWQTAIGFGYSPHYLPTGAGQAKRSDEFVSGSDERSVETEHLEGQVADGVIEGRGVSGLHDRILSLWECPVNDDLPLPAGWLRQAQAGPDD